MPGAQLHADLWITEYMTPHDVYHHAVVNMLAYKKTPCQQMHIIDSGTYGKALVLDGKWQSCTGDEFLYHEPLVHPACINHGRPKNVLILGAGEGAAAREVLKWNTVQKVVMVDIDPEVVEACKQHLPEMHQGSFDDPRSELIIGDALDYLDQYQNEWDIIISDLSDPIEEGPSFKLFTKEYFEKCRRALKDDGYFVVQAGPLGPPEIALHVRLAKTVQTVFNHAASYGSQIPTFASPWGFVLGGNQPINQRPDPETVDKLLAEKTNGNFRMLDGIALLGLMQTPKYIRQAIAAEKNIYTLSQPPKYFGKGIAVEQLKPPM